jgi:uncharacterized protein
MHTDPLLSEQEFEELDRFLMSDQCSDEAMTMDALHGFLTAIAIGPEKIPAAEWSSAVWGAEPEDAPDFQTPQQAQRITHLLERTLEDIEVTLDVAPADFEPLFCELQWKGKSLLDAETWAWGFLEGVKLREAAWQALRASPQSGLLRAIDLLGGEEIEESELSLVDDPMKCHKLAVEVEASIAQIRRFWQARRSQ